ncbi:MAG TPA: ABC transporter permease [Flexivirga sp.]|uniref:ABC transporter permease n=1 Tax=Flexivirga sp. TaxID=1962927 RepID=UPI002B6540AC|nr:ABC transporter permease [Flexivirga sp.]HWC24252.1 ABC transporter permease [Flexivirga sp.]
MSQTLTTGATRLSDERDSAAPAPVIPLPRRRPRRVAAIGRGAGKVAKRSIAIVVFLVLWQIAPKLGWVEEAFLPPFTSVLQALRDLIGSGVLWTDISASLHRSLAGFAIAIVTGIPLGLLIAWYRTLSEILNPLLIIFLNTAAVALLPVFTLILGIGDFSKIMIIAYACFWTVLYNTISGARDVDPMLIRSARSLGLSSRKLFLKVILPAAAPAIFTGVRLAGAVSMLVLVTSEFVGAKAGLGYLIIASQNNFQIPQMYAGIVTISVIGLAFNHLLVLVERRFSRWRT